jgi:hypothetical protein
MVSEFQHGLLRLDTLLVALSLILAGLALAALWTRLGTPVRRRALETACLGAVAAAAIIGCTFSRASWDLSENRGNSLPEADARALRQIHGPLRIEPHLAAEDPRRTDLEHRALSKLRRLMPNVQVHYVAATSIGLFEQTSPEYGEIHYYLGGRTTTSRSTTAEGVLETIYSLAGIAPPKEDEELVFRGHPLAATTSGAGTLFYGVWPALILISAFLVRRRFQ